MKQKIKPILTGILIGIVALPTIAVGSSFTVSLIQGKTVEEAIQILAEQIDFLIARVEIVETKQVEIETEQVEQEQSISELQGIIDQQKGIIENQQVLLGGLQSAQEIHQTQLAKEKACRKMNELFYQAKEICGGSKEIVEAKDIDDLIVALQNIIAENPYMETEYDTHISLVPEYQEQLNQLIPLNSQYKSFETVCNK